MAFTKTTGMNHVMSVSILTFFSMFHCFLFLLFMHLKIDTVKVLIIGTLVNY